MHWGIPKFMGGGRGDPWALKGGVLGGALWVPRGGPRALGRGVMGPAGTHRLWGGGVLSLNPVEGGGSLNLEGGLPNPPQLSPFAVSPRSSPEPPQTP